MEAGIGVRKTSLNVLILSNESRRPYGIVVLLETIGIMGDTKGREQANVFTSYFASPSLSK